MVNNIGGFNDILPFYSHDGCGRFFDKIIA